VTDEFAAGGLELVTLSAACGAADGDATFSRLTHDGRYLVFDSDAADLVPNDTNGSRDVFLLDLESRSLELISKRVGSNEPARGFSYLPDVSDDGRYVVFTADSFELSSPAPTEGGIWAYVRDRTTETTELLPADYACAYNVDISGAGAWLVVEGYTRCDGGFDDGDFNSVFEHDLISDDMRRLGADSGDNYQPVISRDGRFIAWASRPAMSRGTPASQLQIFDREMGTVETLPFLAFHYESLAISDAGDVIAFAENQQVYRYDRGTEEMTLVSKDEMGAAGDAWSEQVAMSGDGRRIVFRSRATNLVPDDGNGVADILLYDASSDTLDRLSVAPDGAEADGDSKYPDISGDGLKVSFASKARNLLPAATNGNYQLYVQTLAVD
jgi:Tol biopolymer transport system component